MLKKGTLSFYDWCIKNHKENILKLWDFDLNQDSPKEVSHASHAKYYFKCNKNIHKSHLHSPGVINRLLNFECPYCNSFAQWCIDNNRKDLLEIWDYENNKSPWEYSKGTNNIVTFIIKSVIYKMSIYNITLGVSDPFKKYYNSFGYYLITQYGENGIENFWSSKNNISPFQIDSSSGKKIWIICQEKNYHDDYLIAPYNFKNGNRCPMCASKTIHPLDSFAQYNINRLGEDFIEKYWNNNNTLDPWKISPFANYPKIIINCQLKDYHQFEITPNQFSTGCICPYCNKKRLHPNDSLGKKFPKIVYQWSDKNIKSPFDYRIKSHEKIWLKCEMNLHEDYKRVIADYSEGVNRCPKCVRSDKISSYEKMVSSYLESLNYTIKYERNCSLIPINPKTGYALPYDNEIIELKLIIEVNGIQHYELSGWHITQSNNSHKTPQEEFEYQLWKDNYKKEYALNKGYRYLAIPYWTFEDGSYINIINDEINNIQNQKSLSTAGIY